MISKKVKNYIAAAMTLAMTAANFCPISVKAANLDSKIQSSSDKAYTWLKSQQDITANQKIVDSFEDYYSNGSRIPISYTYDQACAAIAFLLKGDTQRAVKILDVLKAVQVPQNDPQVRNRGAWCNSYYNNDSAYLAGEELRMHVGVAMWVCMAVMEYEKVTGDRNTYHTMATNAIDWALLFQKDNGGVAGGRTTWDSGNGTWTDEVWSSTEHNEDIYPVLLYFADTTPSKSWTYKNAAEGVKRFLDTVVWDESHQRFYGGYKNNTGLIDPYVPMDVNPWGVLSLGKNGAHTYCNAVNYVENANGTPGTLANPKYKQTLTYDGYNSITAYDFDWQDDGASAPVGNGSGSLGKDIWFEGSAFMADAYYLMGNEQKGNEILNELSKKQSNGNGSKLGGIPYSLNGTNNNYWRMSNSNSVSSTAWYVIASEKFNPFTASYIDGKTNNNSGNAGNNGSTGNIGGGQDIKDNNGVIVNGNRGVIYFKPKSPASWCDVHYRINNGGQQNFRMTYNSQRGVYEQKINNISRGDVIEYSFTYFSGVGYDTETYLYIVK